MEKDLVKIRKNIFGGFNCQDVVDYIEKSKNAQFQYKKDFEAQLSELKDNFQKLVKKKTELEENNDALFFENEKLKRENEKLKKDSEKCRNENEVYKKEVFEYKTSLRACEELLSEYYSGRKYSDKMSSTVSEINKATDELRQVVGSLCESLEEFMLKISKDELSEKEKNSEDTAINTEEFFAKIESEVYDRLFDAIFSSANDKLSDEAQRILSQTRGFTLD